MDFKRRLPRRQLRRLKGYNYAKAGSYFVTLNCKFRFPFFGVIKEGKMILNECGIIAEKEWIRTPEIRPNISLGPFIVMPDHLHGIIIIEKELEPFALMKGNQNNDLTSVSSNLSLSQKEVEIDRLKANLIGGYQVGGVLQPPPLDNFGRLQNARDRRQEVLKNEISNELQNARDRRQEVLKNEISNELQNARDRTKEGLQNDIFNELQNACDNSDLGQNENPARLLSARDRNQDGLQNEISGELIKDSDSADKRNPNFKSASQTLGAIIRGFMGTVTSQINHLKNTPGEKVWQRGFHAHIIRNKWAYHRICIYIRNNPKKWKLK